MSRKFDPTPSLSHSIGYFNYTFFPSVTKVSTPCMAWRIPSLSKSLKVCATLSNNDQCIVINQLPHPPSNHVATWIQWLSCLQNAITYLITRSLGARIHYMLHNCYTLITLLIAILYRIPHLIAKGYSRCEQSTLWVYFFCK